ncbi:MAG: IPTL-CTERM sorting domain-containing protein, partial [Burkholderiales bacterium]|nr:IPTL-CTERM sorting domain-containing protein [Burkholderiales bacterium]
VRTAHLTRKPLAMFTPNTHPPRHWAHPLALAASLLLALAAPLAQAAYTVNADGTVTDSTTGLMWDQCVLGTRTSAATTCAANTNATYTWANALAEVTTRNTASHLGFADWRLPNRNELESLVKLDTHSPAIDTNAFPNTPAAWTWTGTTYAYSQSGAWFVNFYDGFTDANGKGINSYVRLVRSGQSFAAFDALPPVVNGSCGSAHATTPLVTSAPSGNLCAAGTSTSVTAGNSAYTWGCNGSNGGTSTAANACSASRGYTVTPSTGANGSISPSTPQVVAYNARPTFTVAANGGYAINTVTGCGGALSGSTYTTGAVTADCAVVASFTFNTNYTGTSPGGGGNITTQLSGGGASCGLQTVSYQSASAVGAALPAGVTFPQGVVNFTTTNSCTPNGTITVTLTYPSALPAGAQFYKYGPATAGAAPTWYVHPASIADKTITYSIVDNGVGDSNPIAGVIADPGGPGVPGGGAGIAGVPTLSEWAMMALLGLMGLAALGRVRR